MISAIQTWWNPAHSTVENNSVHSKAATGCNRTISLFHNWTERIVGNQNDKSLVFKTLSSFRSITSVASNAVRSAVSTGLNIGGNLLERGVDFANRQTGSSPHVAASVPGFKTGVKTTMYFLAGLWSQVQFAQADGLCPPGTLKCDTEVCPFDNWQCDDSKDCNDASEQISMLCYLCKCFEAGYQYVCDKQCLLFPGLPNGDCNHEDFIYLSQHYYDQLCVNDSSTAGTETTSPWSVVDIVGSTALITLSSIAVLALCTCLYRSCRAPTQGNHATPGCQPFGLLGCMNFHSSSQPAYQHLATEPSDDEASPKESAV